MLSWLITSRGIWFAETTISLLHCTVMSSQGFDPSLKLVTSYVFTPVSLATLRLLFALFTFVTLLFILIWESVVTLDASSWVVLHYFNDRITESLELSFFSYFTNLTFTGLCAYFFASSVQTFLYSKNLKKGVHGYHLQEWPRPLRFLHALLLTTIITFREQLAVSKIILWDAHSSGL